VGSIACTIVVVGLLQCGSCLCCVVVGWVTDVFSLTTVATPNKGKRIFEFFILLLCELFKEKLEMVATVVTVRAVVKEVAERSWCVCSSHKTILMCVE
jgi:hypothetical protein